MLIGHHSSFITRHSSLCTAATCLIYSRRTKLLSSQSHLQGYEIIVLIIFIFISFSSRDTQKAYEEEFKKQPNVKFPETVAKKVLPAGPTPAVRKSKAVSKEPGKTKSTTKEPDKTKAITKEPGKTKADLSDKAQEKLIAQAQRAEEHELIDAIKEVFDRDGTGLVDGQQLRLLLRSLGNKLGKHEMGVVAQFEDKEGMVQYEKLVKTLIFE